MRNECVHRMNAEVGKESENPQTPFSFFSEATNSIAMLRLLSMFAGLSGSFSSRVGTFQKFLGS